MSLFRWRTWLAGTGTSPTSSAKSGSHRAASRSHIVRDDGIDGYVELVQLPEALDEAHKVVAADWFRANRYLEFLPTPYDCSGQKFTNWFKLFRRQGHWFAYHSVSIDV